MKTRNIFSYIMWGLFAVLLSGLYYFSSIEFLNGLNILENKYNSIIVIVAGIIIAVIVFVIDKLLKKGQLTSGDKKYEFYGIIGYIVSFLCFVIYRICNANVTIQTIRNSNVIDSLYKRAVIGSEGNIFVSCNNISELFDTVLSVSFKFLGNNAVGIYIAEFVIGILCFIFSFYAIKAIYGRIEAFIVAIGTAFLPAFAIHNRDYSVYIMEYLLFTFALYFISISKRLLKNKYMAEIGVVISSVITGFAFLYDNINIGLIFLMLVLIIENKNLIPVRKVTCLIASIIPFILTLLIPSVIEAYTNTAVTSIGNYILGFINYRISGIFNYRHLFDFAKSNFILIVIIACIAYVVMFLRCKFDEAHSMILLFVITLAAMCYFVKEDIIAYSLVCIMCLLCIAGAGLKKLIGFKNEDDDEPLVEPIGPKFDESDPDIEILDEGIIDLDSEEENESENEPEIAPEGEPEKTPETEPEKAPEDTPEIEPEVTPENEPEVSPENVPEHKTEEDSDLNASDVVPLSTEEQVVVELINADSNVNMSNADNPSWSVETSKDEGIELFITPLPMPKKGVKRTVNFDYDVPDNMMHFDIELNDENYFYDVV